MPISIEYKTKYLKDMMDKLSEAPEKAMRSTLHEAKKRVPSWVSAEVAKEYAIKRNEITNGKAGRVKSKGSTWDDVAFEFAGRVLSPVHFGMSPTVPKPNRGGYTLKATITKGNRKTLGKVKKATGQGRKKGVHASTSSPVMLMPTGAKSADKVQYIPFQRKSTARNSIEAFKTLSVPQMVDNESVSKNTRNVLDENLSKRLDHYMERYMK